MIKRQQMRWNRDTVQPFLTVRVAVLNNTLEQAFRSWQGGQAGRGILRGVSPPLDCMLSSPTHNRIRSISSNACQRRSLQPSAGRSWALVHCRRGGAATCAILRPRTNTYRSWPAMMFA
jgi:hypothetical protein